MKPYPKPGAVGGKLIRETVGFLRSQAGLKLPIDSHILIATSGGSDSMALAHLVANYGRRVGAKSQVTLLHINHRWRAERSDADEEFVRERAKAWGVKCKVVRLKPPAKLPAGESWEDLARQARKKIYASEAKRLKGAIVLTAHTGDDLAETLLWRLFTGTAATHGGGIVARHGVEARPFLRVRKEELRNYLREVGETWREDETNHEGRFLRSKMRQNLLPEIEKLFPRAVPNLIDAALNAQKGGESSAAGLVISAAGFKLRKAHWEALNRATRSPRWAGELHLPGGWVLEKR